MKFYSEILKKTFDTEKACLAAEKEAEDKKTARQKDAEIVKELEKKYIDAYEAYSKGIKEFVEKHGSYKTTIKTDNWQPLLRHFDFSNLSSLINYDPFLPW